MSMVSVVINGVEYRPSAGHQIGVSDEADFGKGTWTFSMQPGYRVAAGDYYIVPVKSAPTPD